MKKYVVKPLRPEHVVFDTRDAARNPNVAVGAFDFAKISMHAKILQKTLKTVKKVQTVFVATRRDNGGVEGTFFNPLKTAAAMKIQAARRGQLARRTANKLRSVSKPPGY